MTLKDKSVCELIYIVKNLRKKIKDTKLTTGDIIWPYSIWYIVTGESHYQWYFDKTKFSEINIYNEYTYKIYNSSKVDIFQNWDCQNQPSMCNCSSTVNPNQKLPTQYTYMIVLSNKPASSSFHIGVFNNSIKASPDDNDFDNMILLSTIKRGCFQGAYYIDVGLPVPVPP